MNTLDLPGTHKTHHFCSHSVTPIPVPLFFVVTTLYKLHNSNLIRVKYNGLTHAVKPQFSRLGPRKYIWEFHSFLTSVLDGVTGLLHVPGASPRE